MLRARRNGIESFIALGIIAIGMIGTITCFRQPTYAHTLSEVQDRIRSDGRLTMSRFQVIGANGIITLSGFVNTTEQRDAAVQDARQVAGVKVVVDNLKLSGPSRLVITVFEPLGYPPKKDSFPEHTVYPVSSKIVQPTLRQSITSAKRADTTEPATNEQHFDSNHRGVSNGASLNPVSVMTVPVRIPAQVNVPYGTLLPVRLTEPLSSDFNEKGDFFMATLASPILVDDAVVIPEGASLRGRVVEAKNAGRFSGKSLLVIEVNGLGYNGNIYELSTNRYSKQGPSRGRHAVLMAGGGAGLGTILGAIFGGAKGAAIGAIAGAGAGSGVQAASKGGTVQLPAESVVSFRLEAPVTVTPSPTLKRTQEWSSGSSSDPSSAFERPVLKHRQVDLSRNPILSR